MGEGLVPGAEAFAVAVVRAYSSVAPLGLVFGSCRGAAG